MRRRILIRLVIGTVVLAAALVAAQPAGAAGVWAYHPTASPGAQYRYQLEDVSCASTTVCMAVGQYYDADGNGTELAELWNGSSWTIQTLPVTGQWRSFLNSVSCPTTTTCIALGWTQSYAFQAAVFALTWNGTSWSSQPVPPGDDGVARAAYLHGLTCVTATWCKAVVAYTGMVTPGILAFDGTTWTSDTVLVPANTTGASLSDIDCYSTSFCAAVGEYSNNARNVLGLAETWNGSTWHAGNVLSPGNQTDLVGVSCPSAKACIAVGVHTNSNGAVGAVVDRQNGTIWTSAGAPAPFGYRNHELNGVACTSTSFCVTVGYEGNSVADQFSYAASYNGHGWTVEGLNATLLSAISCLSPTWCMGVGPMDDTFSAAGSSIRT